MTTTIHGHAKKRTKTYSVWLNMKKRCNNKNNVRYPDYGGRGIKICERWESFVNFLADMGEKPDGLTLDRKDNNGPYAPWNCRWATRKEQGRNTRSNTFLYYLGKTLCIAEWADLLGIPRNIISARLFLGWTVDRALSEKVRAHR